MASPWLTAAELAAAGLPADCWPGSEFRSRAKLHKLAVPSRLREGSKGGGGREYDTAALPTEVRRALLSRQIQGAADMHPPGPTMAVAAAAVCAPAPTVAAAVVTVQTARKPPSRLEAACADGRLALVNHLRSLAADGGMTRAAEELSRQLQAGQAPEHLLQSAADANQRPRNPAHAGLAEGGVTISVRTLFRWVGDHRKGGWWALCPTPAKSTALANVEDDVAMVLKRYSSATGAARNLTQVVRDVTASLGRPFDDWAQLYGRARRALPKMDRTALIKARHTGAERAAKLPFKRRLTDDLVPNDVWVIDGHTFKAKVRHPDHGQPFAPEVTLAIDVATRKVVGWSVSLSENTIAVGDCIRHAVGQHGVPAIVYSDNGAGERAKVFDCPVVGLFARLGAEHRTGLPGHPQGHGLIERSWQTHMLRAARKFATYQGGDVDERTLRKVTLELAKEQRALKRAEPGGEVVRLNGKVPSWAQFIDAVAEAVHKYNAEHRHRGLPKHTTGTAEGKHLTPDDAWAAMLDAQHQVMLDAAALRHLFMPAVLRTAQRGEVRFLNQHYFATALMQVDEQQVRVHYDIHDGARVYVWTLDGQFVCEAAHTTAKGGNGMPYFPLSAIDAARQRRVQGIVKRREAQIDTALRELQGVQNAGQGQLPAPRAEFQLPGLGAGMRPPKDLEFVERVPAAPAATFDPAARPLAFDTASDRYEWLMQHVAAGGHAADDTAWLAAYAAGPEYTGLRDYYASRGIAWPEDDPAFKSAG